jgi:hypothetical protein
MKNDRNFGCALSSPSEQKLLMTSILRHQVYVIIRDVSLENSWRDSMSHFYAFFFANRRHSNIVITNKQQQTIQMRDQQSQQQQQQQQQEQQ